MGCFSTRSISIGRQFGVLSYRKEKAGMPQLSFMLGKPSVTEMVGYRNINYKIIFTSMHEGVCGGQGIFSYKGKLDAYFTFFPIWPKE